MIILSISVCHEQTAFSNSTFNFYLIYNCLHWTHEIKMKWDFTFYLHVHQLMLNLWIFLFGGNVITLFYIHVDVRIRSCIGYFYFFICSFWINQILTFYGIQILQFSIKFWCIIFNENIWICKISWILFCTGQGKKLLLLLNVPYHQKNYKLLNSIITTVA